jgi:hypothetical protein
VTIAHSRDMPSDLLLPVVPGVAVPTGLPPCPGLRGEPCRAYRAFTNRRGTIPASASAPPSSRRQRSVSRPRFTG